MTSYVYEIHRYKGDTFLYVVARTNKHSEDTVRKDVERMNSMLSEELKAEGIRYVFAMGSMDSIIKGSSKKKSKSNSDNVI